MENKNTALKPELIKKVKDYFNLNIYETKVWLALISKGVASAGEIAEISGVPRSRTYDVLEGLEKNGFAIAKIGKPVKYLAVKPEIVVEKLKSNVLRDAEEKVKTLSTLKDTSEYTELEQLHKTGIIPVKQTDISGAIKGKSNIYSHIREMLENSEQEAIICMPSIDLESRARILSTVFDRLKKAGIKLRIALKGPDSDIKRIERKFNIRVDKINTDGRFFIADRKQALFILSKPDEEEELGIWINSDFFANSLAYLFDTAVRK